MVKVLPPVKLVDQVAGVFKSKYLNYRVSFDLFFFVL